MKLQFSNTISSYYSAQTLVSGLEGEFWKSSQGFGSNNIILYSDNHKRIL